MQVCSFIPFVGFVDVATILPKRTHYHCMCLCEELSWIIALSNDIIGCIIAYYCFRGRKHLRAASGVLASTQKKKKANVNFSAVPQTTMFEAICLLSLYQDRNRLNMRFNKWIRAMTGTRWREIGEKCLTNKQLRERALGQY